MTTDENTRRERQFPIQVLGRTLEHLGTQMYKRRDVAIAELVANSWDAGATHVWIELPDRVAYDPQTSQVVISDDGGGMTEEALEKQYLVIGRNRRADGQEAPAGRPVMGRKGVGKLAGFGFGRHLRVESWTDGVLTGVDLRSNELKAEPGEAPMLEVPGWTQEAVSGESGTRITIGDLKHSTPPDIDGLHNAIARRFSRRVKGEMEISINGERLREPDLGEFELREPNAAAEFAEVTLANGDKFKWWAGFSSDVLPSELQGFTVLVNGKTAQAPPFFFHVESKASGQHGTKYLTGVIEADYLDSGSDDESDRISTDRQEIDWDDAALAQLYEWGQRTTRGLLRRRTEGRAKIAEAGVLDDPDLSKRLDKLDAPSREKAMAMVRSLGTSVVDQGRTLKLSDTIIRAFEYRQFHDYIETIEEVAEDPEELERALDYITAWKVLESRAIREIVQGRMEIVDKFFKLLVNDAPETAHRVGDENIHDLLANFPWLIHPEWQVLAEEKQISTQLREWHVDAFQDDATRYDFLALKGEGRTIVVEIKRSGHAPDLKDLQQLQQYMDKLSRAVDDIEGAFITSERYAVRPQDLDSYKQRPDFHIMTWAEVRERATRYYEEYRSILDGDLAADSAGRRAEEIVRTRHVLDRGSYRSREERAAGVPGANVDSNPAPSDDRNT